MPILKQLINWQFSQLHNFSIFWNRMYAFVPLVLSWYCARVCTLLRVSHSIFKKHNKIRKKISSRTSMVVSFALCAGNLIEQNYLSFDECRGKSQFVTSKKKHARKVMTRLLIENRTAFSSQAMVVALVVCIAQKFTYFLSTKRKKCQLVWFSTDVNCQDVYILNRILQLIYTKIIIDNEADWIFMYIAYSLH